MDVSGTNNDIVILKNFISGMWVDANTMCRILDITFSEGMRRFDFGRVVKWNEYPLNGQYVDARFRLKLKEDTKLDKDWPDFAKN